MSLWLAMVCPRNRVELVIVVGMDSQDTANLISLGSMLATVAAAIYTRRQAIGSKEAKAKADEAHKAALDMRDAAQRSVTVAEEQANQAERSAKAAEEQVHHAEELLEQMSDISSNLWHPEFELTHAVGMATFSLRNVTMGPIKVLDVVNSDQFIELDLKKIVKEFQSGEKVEVTLDYSSEDDNLRLRIDGRENILCVPIEYNLDLLRNR